MNHSCGWSDTFWMRRWRVCSRFGNDSWQLPHWISDVIGDNFFVFKILSLDVIEFFQTLARPVQSNPERDRLHRMCSMSTSRSTITSGQSIAAKWRSLWEAGCGGMRTSGLPTWTSAAFLCGSTRSPRMIPMWQRTCWMQWKKVFWPGILADFLDFSIAGDDKLPNALYVFDFEWYIFQSFWVAPHWASWGIIAKIWRQFWWRSLLASQSRWLLCGRITWARFSSKAQQAVLLMTAMRQWMRQRTDVIWSCFSSTKHGTCGDRLVEASLYVRVWFNVDEREENLRNAEYNVVCANLSADYKDAVSYNLRKNKAGLKGLDSKCFSQFFSNGHRMSLMAGGFVQTCGAGCMYAIEEVLYLFFFWRG